MDIATMEENPPVEMKPLLEKGPGAETQSAAENEVPTLPLSVVLMESRAQEGSLVEGKPKKKREKSRLKKFYIIACCLLLLLVVGSGFSFHLYQTYSATYHNDVSLAKTGAQHLQNAVTLLQAL